MKQTIEAIIHERILNDNTTSKPFVEAALAIKKGVESIHSLQNVNFNYDKNDAFKKIKIGQFEVNSRDKGALLHGIVAIEHYDNCSTSEDERKILKAMKTCFETLYLSDTSKQGDIGNEMNRLFKAIEDWQALPNNNLYPAEANKFCQSLHTILNIMNTKLAKTNETLTGFSGSAKRALIKNQTGLDISKTIDRLQAIIAKMADKSLLIEEKMATEQIPEVTNIIAASPSDLQKYFKQTFNINQSADELSKAIDHTSRIITDLIKRREDKNVLDTKINDIKEQLARIAVSKPDSAPPKKINDGKWHRPDILKHRPLIVKKMMLGINTDTSLITPKNNPQEKPKQTSDEHADERSIITQQLYDLTLERERIAGNIDTLHDELSNKNIEFKSALETASIDDLHQFIAENTETQRTINEYHVVSQQLAEIKKMIKKMLETKGNETTKQKEIVEKLDTWIEKISNLLARFIHSYFKSNNAPMIKDAKALIKKNSEYIEEANSAIADFSEMIEDIQKKQELGPSLEVTRSHMQELKLRYKNIINEGAVTDNGDSISPKTGG